MNSSELKGFLTGLILGDGYLGKGVTKRSFSIKSINKDFIDYIEKEIESVNTFKSKIRNIPEHCSCGCNHKEAWEYIIEAHPYFNKIYNHFYDDYRHRKITSKVMNWLTPVGLANWYMSDGYVCLVGKTYGKIKNRRVDICTDRYYKEDVEMMSDYLLSKFNIKANVIKRNNTYRLRIKQASYENFINLISPYIVPSMQYKMYLGYENKPTWMTDDFWEKQKSLLSAITSSKIEDKI